MKKTFYWGLTSLILGAWFASGAALAQSNDLVGVRSVEDEPSPPFISSVALYDHPSLIPNNDEALIVIEGIATLSRAVNRDDKSITLFTIRDRAGDGNYLTIQLDDGVHYLCRSTRSNVNEQDIIRNTHHQHYVRRGALISDMCFNSFEYFYDERYIDYYLPSELGFRVYTNTDFTWIEIMDGAYFTKGDNVVPDAESNALYFLGVPEYLNNCVGNGTCHINAGPGVSLRDVRYTGYNALKLHIDSKFVEPYHAHDRAHEHRRLFGKETYKGNSYFPFSLLEVVSAY